MPLCVAITITSRPAPNSAARHSGHGRAAWRRATRTTPQPYKAADNATAPVTTGANCHCVAAADRPNGASIHASFHREPTQPIGWPAVDPVTRDLGSASVLDCGSPPHRVRAYKTTHTIGGTYSQLTARSI